MEHNPPHPLHPPHIAWQSEYFLLTDWLAQVGAILPWSPVPHQVSPGPFLMNPHMLGFCSPGNFLLFPRGSELVLLFLHASFSGTEGALPGHFSDLELRLLL